MSASVTVLTFAGARDVVGTASLEVELPAPRCTVSQLMDAICALYPALAPHRPQIKLAVNGEYAEPGAEVKAGDEVALIPPVAGG